MQRHGQPLDHVAGFMNLAALNGCVGTEGATDDFAQRFGAIDEQPADLGITPASIRLSMSACTTAAFVR